MAFPLFTSLPPEIRLLIWELTWPPPQVFEVAISQDQDKIYHFAPNLDPDNESSTSVDNSDELNHSTDPNPGLDNESSTSEDSSDELNHSTMCIRPVGAILSFLQTDFGSRDLTAAPSAKYHHPVTLHIYQESRHHTLRRFQLMKHKFDGAGTKAFYFDSLSDYIWLSMDFFDVVGAIKVLSDCYGSKLDMFHKILVEECEWREDFTTSLAMFPGIQDIHVVQGDFDDWDKLVDIPQEEFQTRAAEAREVYVEMAAAGGWKNKRFWFIDRGGNVA